MRSSDGIKGSVKHWVCSAMCFSATEITVPFTLHLGSSAIQRDIIRHCLDYFRRHKLLVKWRLWLSAVHDGGAKFEKSLDKDLTKFICEGANKNLQGKQWRFKPDA